MAAAGHDGQLVGFPGGDLPVIIHLEGQLNSVEFWSQETAIVELRHQLQAVAGHSDLDQQEPVVKEPARKSSFFKRRPPKAAAPKHIEPVRSSTRADVLLDDIFFRTETELGLYETVRAQVVMVTIDLG